MKMTFLAGSVLSKTLSLHDEALGTYSPLFKVLDGYTHEIEN